jgi:ribokinase
MFDVICVGSNTVDVFADTNYSELIKIMDSKSEQDLLAYPVGAKILIKSMNFTTGGGGTNTAAALANLGHKVGYLGAFGNDANADFIIKDLKRFRIEASLIVKKEGQTGYSIILDSIEHDRTILAYKGVNNELDYKDIKKSKLKTKWFYFSAMMDRAFNTLEKLAVFAEKNGIKITFNPSIYLAEKGKVFLEEILLRTEILVLNKEEAEAIVGKGDVEHLSLWLNKLGPKYVVITDGKNGAYCYYEGYLYYAQAHKTKVVETTGAGDAFASSFLSGIMAKGDMEYALSLATTNAESVITHHGAKAKLLSLKEASIILKKMPVKIIKKKIL